MARCVDCEWLIETGADFEVIALFSGEHVDHIVTEESDDDDRIG